MLWLSEARREHFIISPGFCAGVAKPGQSHGNKVSKPFEFGGNKVSKPFEFGF